MRRTLTITVIVGALALGACSSGDDTGGQAEQPSVEDAVRSYTTGFLAGDPAAYDQLSARCQGVIDRTQFETTATAAAALYPDAEITTLTVESDDGQTAQVTYQLTDTDLNQTGEQWVLERGAWRNDDC